jgi:hypothetical protein
MVVEVFSIVCLDQKDVQCFEGCSWLDLQVRKKNLLCGTYQIKTVTPHSDEDWKSLSKHCTVEPPFNAPQSKVFPYLAFNINDPKLIISVFNFFCSKFYSV